MRYIPTGYVDAEQWFPGCAMPGVIVIEAVNALRPYAVLVDPEEYFEPMLYPGWWVVTHPDGQREVMPPDVFATRYRLAPADGAVAP